jgi:hypothetical protein
MKGFRYQRPTSRLNVSLVTDLEYPALDAEGIFANEADYLSEIDTIAKHLNNFLSDKLKLSVISVNSEIDSAVGYYSLLPNGQALEVAKLRRFGQKLASTLQFQVLQPTNKFEAPFIFTLNLSSKLFVAVVAAHSSPGKVRLPAHTQRAFGMSYGVDVSGLNNLRVDVTKLPFTSDKFAILLSQGVLFGLLPESDNVKIVTEGGEEIVEFGALSSRLTSIVSAHETALAEREQSEFQARFSTAVQLISDRAELAPGFTILGAKSDDPQVLIAARLFE